MAAAIFALALAAQHVHGAPAAPPAAAGSPLLRMARPADPQAQVGDEGHAGHGMPAQGHQGHSMPAQGHRGHPMPAPSAPQPAAPPAAGQAGPGAAVPPAGSGHVHQGMDHGSGGTALPAGDAPPPPPPANAYADRFFDPAAMAAARARLHSEHGGQKFLTVTFNLAEYQARAGGDGYLFDGELWYGGDINRLVVRAEGEGSFGEAAEELEFQALYSRALDAYWNWQAGIRVDAQPNGRAYAVVGVEGLAPYWFDVESALFLSERGDLFARVQASYDQRLTNRLILQPLVELNAAAQDVGRDGIGSGLSDVELGLRLRYEIRREFAPYVGISHERALGDTADFARAAGEDPSVTSFAIGLRTWF